MTDARSMGMQQADMEADTEQRLTQPHTFSLCPMSAS